MVMGSCHEATVRLDVLNFCRDNIATSHDSRLFSLNPFML